MINNAVRLITDSDERQFKTCIDSISWCHVRETTYWHFFITTDDRVHGNGRHRLLISSLEPCRRRYSGIRKRTRSNCSVREETRRSSRPILENVRFLLFHARFLPRNVSLSGPFHCSTCGITLAIVYLCTIFVESSSKRAKNFSRKK